MKDLVGAVTVDLAFGSLIFEDVEYDIIREAVENTIRDLKIKEENVSDIEDIMPKVVRHIRENYI